MLKQAFETVGQGFLALDADLCVIDCSRRYIDMIGYDESLSAPGTSFRAWVDAAATLGYYGTMTADEAWDAWIRRLAKPQVGRRTVESANGRVIATAYVPFDGGWILTVEDRTDQVRIKRDLEEQNEKFEAALTYSPHGLAMFDAERRLILCNRAYVELYDFPPDVVMPGTSFEGRQAFRKQRGNAPVNSQDYSTPVAVAQTTGECVVKRELLQDGRTIRITRNPMTNLNYVAIHEDITAACQAESQVRYLASHDALTGLPNRVAMRERLELALAATSSDEMVAVHYLDLDEFKPVNDSFGHSTGDGLLKGVTERLAALLRPSDTLARLGGDEFIVIQTGLGAPEDAGVLAEKLVEAITTSFEIDQHRIAVGLSIGIALSPHDGRDVETILKNADLALYRAKAEGGSGYRFFGPDMDRSVQARRQMTLDLRKALQDGEFQLFYQPMVETGSGRVAGMEALLRWNHPARGLVPPIEFIPLAEETGLIVPIGEWVIRRACLDAASWPSDIAVAVNLSPVQFKSGTLATTVVAALASSELAPNRLELEITESVQLIDNEPTLATLHQFRALGIRIALDDFGTGYSSLSYLRAFPFDKIKIDKSFVRDLAVRRDCAAIVKAVADLGEALGMSTIAEGIETPEQRDLVHLLGCREVQGYLFSAPKPLDRLGEFLPKRQVRRRKAA